MSKLSTNDFKTVGESQFPDNSSGLITELVMRTFKDNIADSFLNSVDDIQKKTTATGTNSYSLTGGIASYADGFLVVVKFTNASTGIATLNINSLGDKKIFKDATTQASSGDIKANTTYLLVYDSSLDSSSGGFLILGGLSSGTSEDIDGGIL
jgi:hypothetical protein